MTAPRTSAPRTAKPRSKPATQPADAGPGWPARFRPSLSRAGIVRLAGRAVGICAVVGVMTVAAGWHASGMVRRGEIQKMVRMSAGMQPSPPEPKNRGRLDRSRLEAMAAAAAR